MGNEDFIKEHLWIFVLVVLVFTAFVAYTLNKNIDPNEDNDEEEDNLNSNNNDENQ